MIHQLINLIRDLIDDLIDWLRHGRDDRWDFQHVGATEDEGIGFIPKERTVAEIAADGARPIDELADLLATWNAIDYRAWDLVSTKAENLRYKEIEVQALDHHDQLFGHVLHRLERDARAAVDFLRVSAHSRGETWASQPWTRDDWLIAEHGYERPEDLREKAARPTVVDDTVAFTAAEVRALRARLAIGGPR